MMWLPDTPQDHDNRMYEAGRADAADRITELEAELRALYSGEVIVVPKDKAHAEAMHLMATRFLDAQ